MIQCFVAMGSNCVPIPGAMGVADYIMIDGFKQLDFIWHGLHFPDSLPGRQSYLYAFLVLTIGYVTVRKWRGIRAVSYTHLARCWKVKRRG